MNSNNPPFAIGQKVVCIKSHTQGLVRKGNTYVVQDIHVMPCGCWNVNVGVKTDKDFSGCDRHGVIVDSGGIAWIGVCLFAPYNPSQVEIDESIIDQAKEAIGVEEKILMPETVNN